MLARRHLLSARCSWCHAASTASSDRFASYVFRNGHDVFNCLQPWWVCVRDRQEEEEVPRSPAQSQGSSLRDRQVEVPPSSAVRLSATAQRRHCLVSGCDLLVAVARSTSDLLVCARNEFAGLRQDPEESVARNQAVGPRAVQG